MKPSERWARVLLSHLLWLTICFNIVSLSPLHAEVLVVEIVVNEVPKGEFFVDRDESGTFWIPSEEVARLGLLVTPKNLIEKSGKPLFVFAEFSEIESHFDEATLSLHVTAPPQYFPETALDLSSRHQKSVIKPNEESAFLNYRFEYDHDSLQPTDTYGVETEIGVRKRGWLYLSEQRLEENDSRNSGFKRLMTSAQYEWRPESKRLTLGDYFTTGDTLAPSVSLAGVTFSRSFDFEPQFVQYPTLEYAGSVSSPSEIDIYLNEMKIRTEKIPPGNFRLENFTGMMGHGDVEVVVRDSFGRETRMKSPYYLTNRLLKKGLVEYSYSLGRVRENFGTIDDRYGSPILLGYHRLGWRRDITVGGRFSVDDSLILLAPQVDLLASTYGLFNIATGFSSGDPGSGAATTVRYTFQRRPWSLFANAGFYSSGFTTSSTATESNRPKTQLGGGVGWGSAQLGSFSFDVSRQQQQDGEGRNAVGFSYSKRLNKQLALTWFARRMEGAMDSSFSYISLDYIPAFGPKVSARYEEQTEIRKYSAQVQQNAPAGPGYGYLAEVGSKSSGSESGGYLSASGGWKRDYGVYSGDLRVGDGEALSLSADGAVTWVGGVWRASRPVRDSFVLVQTGDLAGVEVSHNGQSLGRTDQAGLLIVPEVSAYYDNQISINDKDIPFSYSLPSVDHYISPSSRSGSCLPFAVAKSRPVTGQLFVESKDGIKPLEYREVELTNPRGEKQVIPTGKGGEFYFDPRDFKVEGGDSVPVIDCRNLTRPGEVKIEGAEVYRGLIWVDSRQQPFTLEVLPGDDVFADLGQIVVSGAR